MLNYFKRTWYFLIFRLIIFFFETILMFVFASKLQILLWRLFNMGVVGMIVGGFLGIIFSYAILSYLDRFLLFILKLWNISAAVEPNDDAGALQGISDSIANVKKHFPALGTVVAANVALNKAGPKLLTQGADATENIPIVGKVFKLSDNFFIRRILRNIVNYSDECAIFYVFKCGDSSENSMITLGRGILFYLKSLPTLLLGSLKLVMIGNILFPVIYFIICIPTILDANGFINTLFTFMIVFILLQIISRVFLELFNMGFMIATYERCIDNNEIRMLRDAENNENRFEEYHDDGDDSNIEDDYEEDEDDALDYPDDDLYADLLSSFMNRQNDNAVKELPNELPKEDNTPIGEFKFEQYIPEDVKPSNKPSNRSSKPSKGSSKTSCSSSTDEERLTEIFKSVAEMSAKEVTNELKSLGLSFFH